MSLETTDVEKIAHLARLGIDAADIPEYTRNLSDILSFVEQLNAADTAAVEPLAHPLEATQRLRPDTVTETDERENFQRVAPQTESGYVRRLATDLATHWNIDAEFEVLHRRDIDEAILEFAGREGMCVMSSHGRSGVARLALGSVTAGVVRHACWPTVVVPYRS